MFWVLPLHQLVVTITISVLLMILERLPDTKIKCVQSDWGGEYQKLHN
jgi:hypothetical protein